MLKCLSLRCGGEAVNAAVCPPLQRGGPAKAVMAGKTVIRKNAKMYFTYVLRSEKDGKFYIGSTGDMSQRLRRHADGFVVATRNRRPLTLVYQESHDNEERAAQRERFFKTGHGRQVLKNLVRCPSGLREQSAKL